MEPLVFYTDGAVKNNKNSRKISLPGGLGVYCEELGISISQRHEEATNNKMELRAILVALTVIENLNQKGELNTERPIIIYSDSMYSINCVSVWCHSWERNGWKTSKNTPVENKELISEIITLYRKFPQTKLKYVKGHAGIQGNEMADQLANQAFIA